jgi:hypothetical protein
LAYFNRCLGAVAADLGSEVELERTQDSGTVVVICCSEDDSATRLQVQRQRRELTHSVAAHMLVVAISSSGQSGVSDGTEIMLNFAPTLSAPTGVSELSDASHAADLVSVDAARASVQGGRWHSSAVSTFAVFRRSTH